MAQIEPFEAARSPGIGLHGQYGHADGAGDIVMRRDSDALAQNFLEGGHDRLVPGDGPLKEDVVTDAALSHNLVEIVVDDRIPQPGDQILDDGPMC